MPTLRERTVGPHQPASAPHRSSNRDARTERPDDDERSSYEGSNYDTRTTRGDDDGLGKEPPNNPPIYTTNVTVFRIEFTQEYSFRTRRVVTEEVREGQSKSWCPHQEIHTLERAALIE